MRLFIISFSEPIVTNFFGQILLHGASEVKALAWTNAPNDLASSGVVLLI
jgi:hypothetical protein